jgi:hypothetical protein
MDYDARLAIDLLSQTASLEQTVTDFSEPHMTPLAASAELPAYYLEFDNY